MKILLSPSESKRNPAENVGSDERGVGLLDDEMWGGREARNAQILAYIELLESADDSELGRVFGTKSVKLEVLARCARLLESARMRAIELYNGVAYKALDFGSLDSSAQGFLLDSVLITSNLFGLVRASDRLPFYHLNKNYKSKELSLNKLYKAQKPQIDTLLSGEDVIIDLRAQVYAKAYPLARPHYTLEIPSGTSHQAKHYRGAALRALAIRYSELLGAGVCGGMAGGLDISRAGQLETELLEYVEGHFARVECGGK